MTKEEIAWLQRLGPAVDKHWDELTDFERRFVEGILERFRQYGPRTLISPKQWEIIAGISEKVL